jgi:hypothetical protein
VRADRAVLQSDNSDWHVRSTSMSRSCVSLDEEQKAL